MGAEEAVYSILAISPSLVIVTLLSSFRGYFQGMQHMTPTALSQIVEQLGKLILGLWFASMYISKGPEYGAAAAVAGVTLSEGAALALVMGMYRRKKKEILRSVRQSAQPRLRVSGRSILSRLVLISFPVTIGSSIMPLIGVADSLIVVNRLVQIGFNEEQAKSLYGLLTGGANPLINFPAVLTIAMAMSLVPAISESYANKDYRGIVQKTEVGVRLTLLLGLPAAAGMAILARPICALFVPQAAGGGNYGHRQYTGHFVRWRGLPDLGPDPDCHSPGLEQNGHTRAQPCHRSPFQGGNYICIGRKPCFSCQGVPPSARWFAMELQHFWTWRQ